MAKASKPKTTLDESAKEGKTKALSLAMEQITKQFGDGAIMKLGDSHKSDVETAFSEGLFLPHDSDLTAEQYYNETHKTK